MSPRDIWTRISLAFSRRRLERELREELSLHLCLRAEQLRRDGMDERDAALAARRRFGNVSRIADASRAAWGWGWLDGASQDLRYVLRQLARSPGFAIVAIVTIALGIAINTAAFTLYDAVVLRPLPVRAPTEMVRIVQNQTIPTPEELPYAAFDAIRSSARSVDAVVAVSSSLPARIVLPGHDPADQRVVDARLVSPDYFSALGVAPALGRAFADGDERVAVVSHAFWTSAFGADPSVIGRRLSIDGSDVTIVGVAPVSFAGTGLPALVPDLWLPMSLQPLLVPGPDWRHDGRPHWQVMARLAAGMSLTQAGAEVSAMARAVPDTLGRPTPLRVKRATFFQTDSGEFEVFQQASGAFMAALALVLCIATVNLVNLIAARNAAREREVTVRLALGAARWRIARQLASESLVLALAGGGLGLGLAWWFARWLRAWIVGTMSSVMGGPSGLFIDLSFDRRVMAYAAAASLFVGLLVGLWPAVVAARRNVNAVLKAGAGSTSAREAWTTRNLLLGTQVAGSVVLLAAAGMLLSGLRRAGSVNTGFDSDHMVVVLVQPGIAPPATRGALLRDVERRIAALPEVRAAAWSHRVPFGGTQTRTASVQGRRITVNIHGGSETLFDAFGVPLLSGRAFTQSEVDANAPVVVVTMALAAREWPGENPIGKVIPPHGLLSGPDTTRAYTVIGVARDVRTSFLSRIDPGTEYFPYSPSSGQGAFLVRTRGNPGAAIRAIRVAVAAASPSLAAGTHVVTLADGPVAVQRLMSQAPAMVALALALLGLGLAAVGAYGLIAQIVSRRTREIGVYMALGASRAQVMAHVLRKTLRPVAWGALLGAIGALAVSAGLRAMINVPDAPDLTFGAGAFNPRVYAGVLATLTLVVLSACLAPARRAARVDPVDALRAD